MNLEKAESKYLNRLNPEVVWSGDGRNDRAHHRTDFESVDAREVLARVARVPKSVAILKHIYLRRQCSCICHQTRAVSGNIYTEINNKFPEIFPGINFWELFVKYFYEI